MSEDEFHVDMRPSATITCDSVITSLLHWQGKLFVGFSGRVIKVPLLILYLLLLIRFSLE